MRKALFSAVAYLFFTASAFAQGLPVVASFSILGDMVKTIGGDDVSITTLVGPDADTHAYEPTPGDLKSVAGAKIIFVNGLGFEGWMDRVVQSSGTKGIVVTASKGVKTREMKDDDHDHRGHDHGETDPHAWQDLSNGRIYARNIADALAAAIPGKADAIRARAKAYDAQIAQTDTWVKDQFKDIPKDQRLVITSHDAFGYFADAYGLTILAPEGISTESAPTARDVAVLIDQIKAHKVKAVFFETMASPRLIQEIAKQAGADARHALYSDALSAPGGATPGYISMFRYNAPLMAAAMRR